MKEFKYTINGNVYKVNVTNVEQEYAELEVNGTKYKVQIEKVHKKSIKPLIKAAAQAPTTSTGAPVVAKPVVKSSASAIKSPLPGVILEVAVKTGDTVKKGQKLLILEAMKMENSINADKDGVVSEIKVNKGDSILEGADLLVIV
ncbi:MAG: biotin/lipoyl-binding protein [Bacteroidales bacterium]|nr:biotin/lipoyl-binding protein [Bacteroidales bacterium]